MSSIHLSTTQQLQPTEVMTRGELIASQGNAELGALLQLIGLVMGCVLSIFACIAACICCSTSLFLVADTGTTDGGFMTRGR